jgi:polyhydroxybutyrate depolymerase
MSFFCAMACVVIAAAPLPPGDHKRVLDVNGGQRPYQVHVPPQAAPPGGFPLVLVFHGFGTNYDTIKELCGMSETADRAGFVVAYPEGTGSGVFRVFNAGSLKGSLVESLPDDVAMTARLIDDLAGTLTINPRRVFAAGMSNGGMMCYRLAAELSDRISAVASVAGTMARGLPAPPRPVPVLHLHGTADRVVPLSGPPEETSDSFDFVSVDETIRFWTRVDGCTGAPVTEPCPDTQDDGTRAERIEYRTADGKPMVVFIKVEGGGHTWPGRSGPAFLGKSTRDISANEIIWDFFSKHGREN